MDTDVLSSLVTPRRDQVLQMVKALALYSETDGYHCYTFSSLRLEAMALYRQAIRSVPENYLYRLATTWKQVSDAMEQAPNEELFQLIWNSIDSVYRNHPEWTAQLEAELPAAIAACQRHAAITAAYQTAIQTVFTEILG